MFNTIASPLSGAPTSTPSFSLGAITTPKPATTTSSSVFNFGTSSYTPPTPLPGGPIGSTTSGIMSYLAPVAGGALAAWKGSAAVVAAIKGASGGAAAGAAAAGAAAGAAAAVGGATVGTVAAAGAAAGATAAVGGAKGAIGGIINVGKGLITNIGAVGKAMFKGSIFNALIGGGISIVTNGMAMMAGTQSMGRTVGNVVSDTGSAVVSGAIAAGAGGLATVALGAMGLTAAPILLIGSLLAGVAGYFLSDKILTSTGIKSTISNTIAGVFGG